MHNKSMKYLHTALANLNNKAKNMESVMFFKTTWHVRVLGQLDYFA